METLYERHIRLQGAHNVRDLGGYATSSGGATRWRSFLRADALHELTSDDMDTLLELGLRTVIDLRSDVEIERQPSAFATHDKVDYVHIPLFDGLAPVDAFFAAKAEYDLSMRYIDAVENCRPAVVAVARAIADAEDGLILFNCTAGKDRTGIVAAMLLSIAGVSGDEIVADYALTETIAAKLMERLRQGARERGLDENASAMLLSSRPAAMENFLRHLETSYGGFTGYLRPDFTEPSHLDRIGSRLRA